jgi:uncharacterized protein DUF2059
MRTFTGIFCLLAITLVATGVQAQDAASRPVATSPSESQTAPPAHGSPKVEPARVEHVIAPIYPPLALAAGGSEFTLVRGAIAKDGTIQGLEDVVGAPVPSPFATDVIAAVSQWRFRPQLVKGRPVEEEAYFAIFYVSGDYQYQAGQGVEISPQFRADAMQLLETIHFRDAVTRMAMEVFAPVGEKTANSFPVTPNKDKIIDAYRAKLMTVIQSEQFAYWAVNVYAKFLSDDDIKSATKFYASPAGQRLSGAELELPDDLRQTAFRLIRDNIPQIINELCEQYPEMQGQSPYCHAPGQTTR